MTTALRNSLSDDKEKEMRLRLQEISEWVTKDNRDFRIKIEADAYDKRKSPIENAIFNNYDAVVRRGMRSTKDSQPSFS